MPFHLRIIKFPVIPKSTRSPSPPPVTHPHAKQEKHLKEKENHNNYNKMITT